MANFNIKVNQLLVIWLFGTFLIWISAQLGWYGSWLVLVPLVAGISLFSILIYVWRHFNQLKWPDIAQVGLLAVIWLSHLLQVFTPETGFDALWYHLPIIKGVTSAGKLAYQDGLRQSADPYLIDLIIGTGYFWFRDLGAKAVAYLLAASIVPLTFSLGRKWLNIRYSLYVVSTVSLFQVITWQSSSVYVDLGRAFFELAAIYYLFNKKLLMMAVFFGIAMASKLIGIFLLPYFLLVVAWQSRSLIKTWWLGLVMCLPSLPFWTISMQMFGTPWYGLVWHEQNFNSQFATQSLGNFIIERLKYMWQAPEKAVFSRDYLSPIVLMFPLIMYSNPSDKRLKELTVLTSFVIWQIMIWWFLPPLSSRYALSGFVVAALVAIIFWQDLEHKSRSLSKLFHGMVWILIIVSILPRLAVNYRTIRYWCCQSKSQYLQQFIEPHTNHIFVNWYGAEILK